MIKLKDIDSMSEERCEDIVVDLMDTLGAKYILKQLAILEEEEKHKKRNKKKVDTCNSWKEPAGGFRSMEERDMFYK